jgi:hypothetical protein
MNVLGSLVISFICAVLITICINVVEKMLKEENAEVKNLRLLLSANVAKVITSGMGLLGIEMPERM